MRSFFALVSILPGLVMTLTPGMAGSATTAGGAMRVDIEIGGMVKVNSVARLLAGLPPTYPGHRDSAESATWKEHSAAMGAALTRLNNDRGTAMAAWRDSVLQGGCGQPASAATAATAGNASTSQGAARTLFYPFSGPDFFNAHLLFPGCDNYLMFGLEHVGDLPAIDAINERDLARLLTDVRRSVSDLFDRNYFITENMSRQLRTSQLHGVLPLLVIPMALSGVEILRIVPNEAVRNMKQRVVREATSASPGAVAGAGATAGAAPAVDGSPAPEVKPVKAWRPMRQLNGVIIEFRKPGSSAVQRLHYFTVDATDRGLSAYPEFIDYLRGFAPTTSFVKSASYLLHGREFSRMRQTVLDMSEVLVQDDTGVPYSYLTRWNVSLYGRYEIPIRPFEKGYFQPALDRAFKEANPALLSFDFGYNYSDRRDNRSNVLVARRRR